MVLTGVSFHRSNRQNSVNQSLKQRVNSVVLKALADNSDRDRRAAGFGGGGGGGVGSGSGTRANSMDDVAPPAAAVRANAALVEPMSKDAILRLTRVVMTAKESAQVVDKIIKGGPAAIGVDGEGINLGTKGQLTLLQIATMEKQTYIFDLMADPTMWNEGKQHYTGSYTFSHSLCQ